MLFELSCGIPQAIEEIRVLLLAYGTAVTSFYEKSAIHIAVHSVGSRFAFY